MPQAIHNLRKRYILYGIALLVFSVLLVNISSAFADTTVTVSKNGNAVKAIQLMKLMGMGIKQGDVVTVAADGPSEDAAIAAMQTFFRDNL